MTSNTKDDSKIAARLAVVDDLLDNGNNDDSDDSEIKEEQSRSKSRRHKSEGRHSRSTHRGHSADGRRRKSSAIDHSDSTTKSPQRSSHRKRASSAGRVPKNKTADPPTSPSSTRSPKSSHKSPKSSRHKTAGVAIGAPIDDKSSDKKIKERARRSLATRPGAKSVSGDAERSTKERRKEREGTRTGAESVTGKSEKSSRAHRKERGVSTQTPGAEAVHGKSEKSSKERRKHERESTRIGANSVSGNAPKSNKERRKERKERGVGASAMSGDTAKSDKERRKDRQSTTHSSSVRRDRERAKNAKGSSKRTSNTPTATAIDEQGDIALMATTVEEEEETEGSPPNQEVTDLRNENEELVGRLNDLESMVQEQETDKRQTRKKMRNRIACASLLCLAIAGGVVGFLLTRPSDSGDTKAKQEDIASAAPSTVITSPSDEPSLGPSMGVTPVPTISPTAFFYEIPSEDQCSTVRNQEPVTGEEEMQVKSFGLDLDLTLADPEIGEDTWTDLLSEQLQTTLVPELACCSGDVDPRSISGNRCVTGNANATATFQSGAECIDTTNESCIRSVVVLSIALRGEELNRDVVDVISSIVPAPILADGVDDTTRKLQGTNFAEKYDLPTNIFSSCVAVNVRNLSPTSAPSVAPSLSPSEETSNVPSLSLSSEPSTTPSILPSQNPSIQPVLGVTPEPTNVASLAPSLSPTIALSQRPSLTPVVGQTPLPTVQPTFAPTPSPTSSPTSSPTPVPTIWESSVPSSEPSSNPSSIPSIEPSRMPSDSPSKQPSPEPSEAPSEEPSIASSSRPSFRPSANPSSQPSKSPTPKPSQNPTQAPSIGYFGPVTKTLETRMSGSGRDITMEIAVPPAAMSSSDVTFELYYFGDIDASDEWFDISVGGTTGTGPFTGPTVGACNGRAGTPCFEQDSGSSCGGTLTACGGGGPSCRTGWTGEEPSFTMTPAEFNGLRDSVNDKIRVFWDNNGGVSRTFQRDCHQIARVTITYEATREN